MYSTAASRAVCWRMRVFSSFSPPKQVITKQQSQLDKPFNTSLTLRTWRMCRTIWDECTMFHLYEFSPVQFFTCMMLTFGRSKRQRQELCLSTGVRGSLWVRLVAVRCWLERVLTRAPVILIRRHLLLKKAETINRNSWWKLRTVESTMGALLKVKWCCVPKSQCFDCPKVNPCLYLFF